MRDPRKRLGDLGEAAAAHAIEAAGGRIVDRNARTRYGEIDLIARDGRGWMFIEVKTRRRGSFVSAREAVDARKLARLHGLALAWTAEHRVSGSSRLVIAAVTADGARLSVDIIEIAS